MTLVEFLLACIAEDETLGRPRQLLGDEWHSRHCAVNDELSKPCDCDVPARWLAECAAKRRIVEEHQRLAAEFTHRGAGGEYWRAYGEVLGELAAVYADHPDYREEWRA